MDSITGSTVPLPPLFPTAAYHPAHHPHHTNNGVYAPLATIANPQNLLRACGQLSWLSPKAGLIQCSAPVKATVSFQLKDFCDSLVTDLTTVLRVGFQLSFHAVATGDASDSNNWIANFVAPITDADLTAAGIGSNGQQSETGEINLEEIEQNVPSASRQSHKDPYSMQMEYTSLTFLLSVFQKSGVHFVSLSSLHSKISNSGREELYRYIGSSSLKRRQFIERRSYIFCIADNDMVYLQPAEIFTTVCLLSSYLLRHGGVTSSDALFAYFNNSATVPQATKDGIQKNRHNFMTFLSRHPFVFSPFPSQFYVSVRRNLPYFDYQSFIKKYFPSCVYPRNCIHGPIVGGPTAVGPIGPLMEQRPTLPFVPFAVDPSQHRAQAVGAPGSIPVTPITPAMPPMTPLFPELVSGGGGGADGVGMHPPHPLMAQQQPQTQQVVGAQQRMIPTTPVSSSANIWSPAGDFLPLGLFDHHPSQHPRQDSLSSLFSTNGHPGSGGVFALAGNPRSATDLARRPSELGGFYLPAGNSNPSSPIPPLMGNGGCGGVLMGSGRRVVTAPSALPTTESATQTDQSLVWQPAGLDRTGADKFCTCKCSCGARSGANDSAVPVTPTLFSFDTASRVASERSQQQSSSSASPPNNQLQKREQDGEQVSDESDRLFDPFARMMPFDLNQLHLN